MATTFFPLLSYYLPPYIGSHHFWAIIWVGSLLVFYPQILLNREIKYLLTYGFFIFIATITIWIGANYSYRGLFLELYELAIGLSIFSYFIQKKDYEGLAKLTKWSMIFICITAIMTIITSSINPMYARDLIGVSAITNKSEIESILSFQRYGGGNYSTAIAFMGLFPLFIYYYKNNKVSIISRKQIVILSIIFFMALLGMQIFANILVALTFSILALLSMKRRNQNILLVVLIFFSILIIPQKVFTNSLISLSGYFKEKTVINMKLKDLALFVQVGSESKIDEKSEDTGAAGRFERYPQLFEIFVKSPLLGSNFLENKSTGQGFHLFWMNKLTTHGLIGFLFFLLIPYRFIKNNLRHYDSNFKYYYILASLSILCYGLFKNIAGRDPWYAFFVIIPGLYYLPLLKKSSKNYDKGKKNSTYND